MSLFKNRIPRNSVSFSAEPYELPCLIPKEKEHEKEHEKEQMEEIVERSEYEMKLEESYAQLELEKQNILVEQQKIEEAYKKIEKEKQRMDQWEKSVALEKEKVKQLELQHMQEMEMRRRELENEKTKMYYDIGEFIWEQSIEIAEKIVHQAIKTNQISMFSLIEGTIKQLPISFEKLNVIVHPETIEQLKKEANEDKAHWLLNNLEWKYDLSLQFGEFIIEEEKEFFEYRFQDIFQMFRKKLNEKKYLEGEGNNEF